MTTATVVRVDPYHSVYGLLLPELIKRLKDGFSAYGDDGSSMLAQFMSRLMASDQGTLLLAAVDPTGQVKGHTAAYLVGPQLFFIQPKLDEPTENDVVAEMIEYLNKWASENKVDSLVLLARRLDSKWNKKFGFELQFYTLVKEINA